MKKDHGIASLEEILCRRSAASSGGEIVDEADHLVFKRYGGSTGSNEDYSAVV